MQKLRVTENKQTEYTKKLMKEKSLLEMHGDREQMQQCVQDNGRGPGFGGICDMEIGYQVDSMREFRCGDPFGFISSVFIL